MSSILESFYKTKIKLLLVVASPMELWQHKLVVVPVCNIVLHILKPREKNESEECLM